MLLQEAPGFFGVRLMLFGLAVGQAQDQPAEAAILPSKLGSLREV